ncbi:acyl-CoA thioesterase [bacterium]|nr:acyl-CoA thioesterase [bacterium]MCP5461769.1 acyl-CoA thioesterase [bacterium]
MGTQSKIDTQLRVRYYEVDQMGVVHHSRYFMYFEIGRTELLRNCGYTYKQFEESGLFLVVIDVACKYKAPIRYDDTIILSTELTHITPAKIQHSYHLWNHDRTVLHATGSSTLACVNTAGELQRIPDFLQSLIVHSSS